MNNSNFTTEKSLFEKCQCFGHQIEIQRYKDTWGDGHVDEGFNLNFWNLGHSADALCWRERWRWIWNIFRTGNPWADGVIINNEQAKHVVDYINKHLPENDSPNCCPVCNTPEGQGSSCGYCNSNHDK